MVHHSTNANACKHVWLADALKRDILTGKFGQRLPGIHVLSENYAANFKTINKAVHGLEKEGLLKTCRGEGRHIVRRGMKKVRPRMVVLLIQTEGHLHSNFAMDIARRLQEQDWCALPINAEHFKGTEAEIKHILSYRPVGLVFDGFIPNSFQFFHQYGDQFPRKVVWNGFPKNRYPGAVAVCSDDCMGLYRATQHLIQQGRRRIVFLNYRWNYPEEVHPGTPHELQIKGYEKALTEAGLQEQKQFLFITSDQDANLQTIRAVSQNPPASRPDGLVTYADFRAVQAIRAIRQLGLRVPDDVAVVGYNNTPWTESGEVPLSSVDIREKEIARIIVENLVGEYHPDQVYTIEPQVVARASSRCATEAVDGQSLAPQLVQGVAV
ncbi:MAG: substrate-binding domain-containing protein [Verrucomicrobia bacterium]|nr:substrate-binding domain-containing protein [Verrucomicrobiota bacterium]